MSADIFQKCVDIKVLIDGQQIEKLLAPDNNCYNVPTFADTAEIIFTYKTITVPSTAVEVSYTVTADGRIAVQVHYHGKKGLPELPVFGIRFIMPTKASGYMYEGLSGETYPDRMAGGVQGSYEVKGLPVTPYLVPQDCGMHMQTESVTVYRTNVLDNSFHKCGKNRTYIPVKWKTICFFLSSVYGRRVGKCNASRRTASGKKNGTFYLRRCSRCRRD